MTEQEFRTRADEAIEQLHRALLRAAEEHDFDADVDAGALSVEFADPPGRFVVSPQSATSQIWVSAHSKSYKMDWDAGRGEFVLAGTGQTLKEMLAEAISRQLGEDVRL